MLQTRCWALGLCGPAALEFQSKGEMHWKGPTHHPSDKCGRSPGSILKEQDVKRWRGFKAGRWDAQGAQSRHPGKTTPEQPSKAWAGIKCKERQEGVPGWRTECVRSCRWREKKQTWRIQGKSRWWEWKDGGGVVWWKIRFSADSFFLKKIFIYFWMCWVLVATRAFL